MDLLRLAVAPVARDEEPRFRALMDAHHYRGAPSKIGQTVWYAVDDGSGEWIGWSRREPFGRLHRIANNVRLLLRGRRPNLGSRFLALCARRISADWQARHHHPLRLLETFVDPARFHGRSTAPPPPRFPAGALRRRHALRGDGMDVDPRMDPEPQPAMLDRFRCRRIDGVYQVPGVSCIRNIRIQVDPDPLARATARFCREHGWDPGAGIAVDGKTLCGAVDGAGRQTPVLGASTHGASAPLAQKKRS